MKKTLLILLLLTGAGRLMAQKLNKTFTDSVLNNQLYFKADTSLGTLLKGGNNLSNLNSLQDLSKANLIAGALLTNKTEGYNMPVAILNGNSRMPVIGLQGNSKMPVTCKNSTNPSKLKINP